MITRIVKLTFKQEYVNDFFEIFNNSKEKIRSFDGCKHLELLQKTESGNVFFTYSRWEDQASLDKYRNSHLFRQTWTKTKKLFAENAEAWSLDQIHKSE
jgi:autoinducer 2-degrading protein